MITRLDRLQGRDIYENTALAKINELVDAVNELQESQNTYWTDIGEIKAKIAKGFENLKAPADPYAEQRRWIGCVCRFWYDNPNDTLLDYLDKIQTGKNGVEYYSKESGDWFPHCEPVKPDDDIIYKGE